MSPRPQIYRHVSHKPKVIYYKPAGIPKNELVEVVLSPDHLESFYLKDLKNMSQQEASQSMGVSQSTFHRIYRKAKEIIADALCHGKAIRMEPNELTNLPIKRELGLCVCEQCGYQEKKQKGKACMQIPCPQCKTPLIRQIKSN